MTAATLEAIDMARKAREPQGEPSEPIGPILAHNLARLGYAETVVKTAEVARRVSEHTGKPMSRQRIAAILNAVRVTPETVKVLAEALGVKPSELTRKPRPKG